jgi:hypothetical protein
VAAVADLNRMRADWDAVFPCLDSLGWSAQELVALREQAAADMASGNLAVIEAWAKWLSDTRRNLAGRACINCAHLTRSGKSDGLCGSGRPDLAFAFSSGHPLRRLPLDKGVSCTHFLDTHS